MYRFKKAESLSRWQDQVFDKKCQPDSHDSAADTSVDVIPVYRVQNLTNLFTGEIHILGSFQNIKIARDAIVSLNLGSPPGMVYAGLRMVASRMKQRAL